MNKIKNRALSVLLVVGLALTGIVIYIARFVVSGGEWASFAANAAVFRGGALVVGTLVDRNGVVLAGISDGSRIFADSADVRRACLHLTGDTAGNIGTGALSVYASALIGYNPLTGTYSRVGEGETVTLTVDSKLNLAAYKALGDRRGAVAVMDYRTGEILCMVSSPTYDPQNPPKIEEGDAKYEGVYLNRVLSAAYTPGSTFKLITASAAIEKIPDIINRVFECSGKLKLDGGEITCMRAHGTLTWSDALAVSCNTAFAELSVELGADTLASYAEKYGLLERLDVGGIKTASGGFDKAESGTADLAWSGIGQSGDTVNPAAMLRYVGAIANGGNAVNMSVKKKTGLSILTQPRSTRIMKKETADTLGEMMEYNVSHTYGKDSFPGLDIHAKSGTAEVGGGREPHSWFVGYIDNEGYPLAFVVVVENGGHGSSVAGSVANKVLQLAIDS